MKKLLLLFIFLFGAGSILIHAQLQSASTWSINGNAGTTSSHFLGTIDNMPIVFKTNNSERMRLLNSGTSLGIGTSTPNALLHLHDTRNLYPTIASDSTEGTRKINTIFQITYTNAANGFSIYRNSDSPSSLFFKQHEQAKIYFEGPGGGITIAPNGNIGVGTGGPQQKLHVEGNTYLNGNVGIGVVNPTGKLEVNGSFKANYADITEALYAKDAYISRYLTAHNLYSTSVDISAYLSTVDLYATNATVSGLLQAQKMRIEDKLCAKEIVVSNPSCWPDFVFDKNYKLLPLKEVEHFINTNQHLPNVPSAAEVEANGVNLGEMNAILIQKVEELTLYIIQMEKRLSELENKKGGK